MLANACFQGYQNQLYNTCLHVIVPPSPPSSTFVHVNTPSANLSVWISFMNQLLATFLVCIIVMHYYTCIGVTCHFYTTFIATF